MTPRFEVRNPQTGEAMKVFADGTIEGFPPGFDLVVNRIPLCESAMYAAGQVSAEMKKPAEAGSK